MPEDSRSRALVALGVALFLVGLLTGLAVQSLTNPRMGLSAHLEGVMNGTFLIAVGAVWPRVRLPETAAAVTFWLLAYGTVANWLFTLLAAAFGTSSATPIAGAGHAGLPWQEALVNLGLFSLSIAIIAACGLLLWGLLRRSGP
jgi:(hydroxyamino)benzene mutase